jgi:hypothetical protein
MLRMKRHRVPGLRSWLLVVIAAVLIAGHGFFLYYVSSHLVLSVAILWGVAAGVVIKHLGLLGSFYALIRRRLWRSDAGPTCGPRTRAPK